MRAALVALVLLAAPLQAHHGSAEYDTTREITVRGTVVAWRWINPHVRVVIRADRGGTTAEWDCEGPPLTWAAERGWSERTLTRGESITLVMYPLKTTARGGLVKRIVTPAGTLEVSRPWLDRP